MRVELVGGLGVGKTTLANAFKEKGCDIVTEVIEENPFLVGCYQGKQDYEFPSQLWFIQTKFKELLDNRFNDRIVVYDQSLLNTRAYVDTYLGDPMERKLMHDYMDVIDSRMGYADLYIYLELSIEEQLKRIAKRGREMEQQIPVERLQRLKYNIDTWVPSYPNVVTINIENMPLEHYQIIANDYTK